MSAITLENLVRDLAKNLTEAESLDIERKIAFDVRAKWMTRMGHSPEEIAEACIDDGAPIDLADEIENLRCAQELKEITPPISVLESWAIKR